MTGKFGVKFIWLGNNLCKLLMMTTELPLPNTCEETHSFRNHYLSEVQISQLDLLQYFYCFSNGSNPFATIHLIMGSNMQWCVRGLECGAGVNPCPKEGRPGTQ